MNPPCELAQAFFFNYLYIVIRNFLDIDYVIINQLPFANLFANLKVDDDDFVNCFTIS